LAELLDELERVALASDEGNELLDVGLGMMVGVTKTVPVTFAGAICNVPMVGERHQLSPNSLNP